MKPNAEMRLRIAALAFAAVGAGLIIVGVAGLVSPDAAKITAGAMLLYVVRSLFA